MRQKLQQFMMGRYGMDALGKFTMAFAIFFVLLSMIDRTGISNALAFIAIVLAYFRMFSRNHPKRYQENMVYMKYQNQVIAFFHKKKSLHLQKRTYHIYSCPSCKQKIRIPKGKGKINISCPKCHTEFIKRS